MCGTKKRFKVLTLLIPCVLSVAVSVAGQEAGDARLASILARAGESVERYHAGMFSVRFTETYRTEELKEDLTPKHSTEFVYDSLLLREELSGEEGDYVASTTRRLKTVNGKPPKKDEEGAETHVTYGEFLNLLLPRWQKLYLFSLEGEDTVGGRRAFRVAALRPGEGEARAEWEGKQFRVLAPTKTRVWIDAESFDVLRVETHLVEPFEFESPPALRAGPFGRFGPTRRLRYAREDFTVAFRRVQFKDPEQALLLPEWAEWLRVIEGASRPRLRTRVAFSNYRRFVSGVKVVEEPEPNE